MTNAAKRCMATANDKAMELTVLPLPKVHRNFAIEVGNDALTGLTQALGLPAQMVNETTTKIGKTLDPIMWPDFKDIASLERRVMKQYGAKMVATLDDAIVFPQIDVCELRVGDCVVLAGRPKLDGERLNQVAWIVTELARMIVTVQNTFGDNLDLPEVGRLYDAYRITQTLFLYQETEIQRMGVLEIEMGGAFGLAPDEVRRKAIHGTLKDWIRGPSLIELPMTEVTLRYPKYADMLQAFYKAMNTQTA